MSWKYYVLLIYLGMALLELAVLASTQYEVSGRRVASARRAYPHCKAADLEPGDLNEELCTKVSRERNMSRVIFTARETWQSFTPCLIDHCDHIFYITLHGLSTMWGIILIGTLATVATGGLVFYGCLRANYTQWLPSSHRDAAFLHGLKRD